MANRKKAALFNLESYLDSYVAVHFIGGRECRGVLRGFDTNMNLVLDGAIEVMRNPNDFSEALMVANTLQDGTERKAEQTRVLGAMICKGASVAVVCPLDGLEEIVNPFLNEE